MVTLEPSSVSAWATFGALSLTLAVFGYWALLLSSVVWHVGCRLSQSEVAGSYFGLAADLLMPPTDRRYWQHHVT